MINYILTSLEYGGNTLGEKKTEYFRQMVNFFQDVPESKLQDWGYLASRPNPNEYLVLIEAKTRWLSGKDDIRVTKTGSTILIERMDVMGGGE